LIINTLRALRSLREKTTWTILSFILFQNSKINQLIEKEV